MVSDNLAAALQLNDTTLGRDNVYVLEVGESPAGMLANPQVGLRAVRSAMLKPLGPNLTLFQAPTNFVSFHPFSDSSWVLENFAPYTVSAEVGGTVHTLAGRGWVQHWHQGNGAP